MLGIESASRHAILEMNSCEHLGFRCCAFGFCFDDAVHDGLACFFQNPYDIECRARRRAGEHELHRAGAEISPAGLRSAVNDDSMAAAGFGNEAYVLNPFYPGFHWKVARIGRLDVS